MRRLEGVMESSRLSDADDLKRYALFFDRVHLIKVSGLHSLYDLMHTVGLRDPRRTDAELDFLEKRGFISGIDERSYQGLITKVVNTSQFIEQAEHHDLFHEHMGFVNFSNIIANISQRSLVRNPWAKPLKCDRRSRAPVTILATLTFE
jgi:hypothetical protein